MIDSDSDSLLVATTPGDPDFDSGSDSAPLDYVLFKTDTINLKDVL